MTTPKDIAEGWFKAIGNGDVAGAMKWIGPDTVFTAGRPDAARNGADPRLR